MLESSTVSNTATLTAPGGVSEIDPGNNTATDTDLGPVIFADGFESGELGTWSVVP